MDIYKKMMNVLVAVKKNNISVFLRFVSAGTKFELKRHGSRISFGLPVSFMYSKNSLKRNMMIFSDNDTDYDSSGAKLEAINRSHTLERIDMGVSIALETIKCGNFSLLLEPEIAFAGGGINIEMREGFHIILQ
ncbi:MAG TPA: hypothetical protein VHO70_06475 [Chitinispirillaceae bacterium]|nr:hypothetical protein [Chitinispirillaceae bacterium]